MTTLLALLSALCGLPASEDPDALAGAMVAFAQSQDERHVIRESALVFAAAAVDAAQETGIPATTILAVAWVESTWDPDTGTNRKGMCGVMQVAGGRYGHPRCGALVGNVPLAIMDGALELASWLRACGPESFLAAYHGGNAGCRKRNTYYTVRVRRIAERLDELTEVR